jgi:hypothetical protein
MGFPFTRTAPAVICFYRSGRPAVKLEKAGGRNLSPPFFVVYQLSVAE